jgi:hypothetical protein
MTAHRHAPSLRLSRRSATLGGLSLAAAAALGGAAGRRAAAGTDATPGATAGATPGGTPSADGATVLVRVEYIGGFVAPMTNLVNLPIYQLSDDGREITQGPQILIYPPPALPNLQVARLTGVGIQAVLDAADAAGLASEDASYSNDNITDLPTLTISVVTGDRTVVTTAYGLDMIDETTQPDLVEPRDRIQGFLGVIQNPASLRDPSLVAEIETGYAEGQLQVVAVPAAEIISPEATAAEGEAPVEGTDPVPPIAWPLDQPLADFGIPLAEAVGGENYEGIFPGARVDTLSGDDLAAVRPLAETANQLSVWRDGEEDWVLLLRPLLPGEVPNLARPELPGAPVG